MTPQPTDIIVSVVIPAYNQATLLARLLDSLVAMEDAPVWEVIIVDDASTDNTAATVTRWLQAHADVRGRLIRQEHNRGPGAARNRGLEAAQGEFVAFTDTDCVVNPGWLAALVSPFSGNEPVVGVGGAVRPYNPGNAFARYNTMNRTLEPIISADYAIPYLVTCNCCYRRDALLGVGGFPTDIPQPGGEDVAASISLYKQGHRFAFAPAAHIQHDYRDTWRSFARTWRNYGRGCGLIAQRLLSPEELNPEWGKWDGDNYWGVYAIRPTVTGVRSFFKDLRWHWKRCRMENTSTAHLPALLLLRAVDRLCYLRGWRAGVLPAHGEAPPPPDKTGMGCNRDQL